MPFVFTEQHITEYYHHGYTIFRGVLPPPLVEELRMAGEELHQITIKQRGPNAARSPVIAAVTEQLSPQAWQAFRHYCELPELRQAIHHILSPEHTIDQLNDKIQAFFTYTPHPTCQDWHRDIDDRYKGITEPGDREEFRRHKQDPTFFAQVGCALYTDTCLWYVPGSAGRPNTQGELAAAGVPYNGVEGRGKLVDEELKGKSYAAQERLCLEYCQGMPNAVNVVLEAGDFCLYRNTAWHTGNYAPHRKRLTLTHMVGTPNSRAWFAAWSQRLDADTEELPRAV